MNILFVNTVPTEENGITNVIFNLLSAFPKGLDSIGYVAINKPTLKYAKLIRELGLRLFVLPRKITSPIEYIKRLRIVAKEYDIMHVHGNSATMVLEMIAAKLAGVKLRIAHSHNTTCEKKLIDKMMRPLFYSLCNGRLACGVEAGKWLFGKRHFKIINNGIDSDRFRFNQTSRGKIREQYGMTEKIVVGNVGNLLIQKNHTFLLDIFSELSKTISNSILLLVGDGPLKKRLQEKAEILGIKDKVIFTGSIDNPEDYMSTMDIVVMPSLFEGLPLTLVEEQANGLSCIVSDAITRDVNLTANVKFLPLNGDVKKWASTVLMIIHKDNYSREDKTNDAIGKIRSKKFDINTIAKDLKNYYYDQLKKTKN